MAVFCNRMAAQEKQAGIIHLAEQRLAERGEVIILFIKPAGRSLDHYTRFLSIDMVSRDTVTAYANKKGFIQFLAENIPFEVLTPPVFKQKSGQKRQLISWHDKYPSYSEYIGLMDSFSHSYPELCKVIDIGKSVNDHRLLVMKITDNPGIREAEPAVFLSSTIHGDEPLGLYLMLRMAEELLGKYGTESRIRKLVDSLEIWINPLANPDGTYFLSDSSVSGATRFNANQVDLNRNFPDPAEGDHPDNNSWQNETVAMMNFMKSIPLILSANLHGGAELVNYPWDAFAALHPDDTWYRQIARAYADTAQAYGPPGYMNDRERGITNGYQWYPVHGGRQDYVNFFLHGREVSIEMSYNKIPAESGLNDYWNYNRNSLLQYISQAFTGVTGEVTDSVTGSPVMAIVGIEGHDDGSSQVYTEAENGRFYRLAVPDSYIFTVMASGYRTKKIPVVVTRDKLTTLNVKLASVPEDVLFPNPFSDLLYIVLNDPGETLELQFYDHQGRKVKHITQQVTDVKQEISVKGLAPGIYIVNMNYRNRTTRQVMVKKNDNISH